MSNLIWIVYILSISDENWQKVGFWKTTKRVTLGKKYMPAFKDFTSIVDTMHAF